MDGGGSEGPGEHRLLTQMKTEPQANEIEIIRVYQAPVKAVWNAWVEEGQVAVQHALMPYGAPKLLNPGDYLRVYKNEPLVRNRYEKGDVIQRVFNALAQAVQAGRGRVPTIGGTPGAGGGRPLPGDSGGGDVPPPPVPPPPPPPPPPGD